MDYSIQPLVAEESRRKNQSSPAIVAKQVIGTTKDQCPADSTHQTVCDWIAIKTQRSNNGVTWFSPVKADLEEKTQHRWDGGERAGFEEGPPHLKEDKGI